MTSRERFLKVFRGELPDRVPVTLFLADQGHFLSQMYPRVDPWDFDSLQLKVLEIQKQLGLDVFVRLLYGIWDPLNIIYGGLDVSRSTDTWEVSTGEGAQREHPDRAGHHPHARRDPHPGLLDQRDPCRDLHVRLHQAPHPEPQDLEMARKYEPQMPPDWPKKARDRVQRVKKAVGQDGIVGTWSPHGPYNNCSLLMEANDLYSLFLVDFGFYQDLMSFALERSLPYAKALDEAGVDVHCVGGNVPGGFLGKPNYDKYILGFEKRYIDFVQQKGTPAMYHNCGQVMALVESYKELGVRIVEPFSPPPLGDADLAEAKRRSGGAYVILAGIDQVNVLQKGTVEQVKRATERDHEDRQGRRQVHHAGRGFPGIRHPRGERRGLRESGDGKRGLLKEGP